MEQKFKIGDVVRCKSNGHEHLITGFSQTNDGEWVYSIDDDQPLIAWFFPAKDEDDYEIVGHKEIKIDGVTY